MTDRRTWGMHVMDACPELAETMRRFNEIFGARVIKMEVEGDPKASWGKEVEWQKDRAVVPYFKKPSPQKVEKYKPRNRKP